MFELMYTTTIHKVIHAIHCICFLFVDEANEDAEKRALDTLGAMQLHSYKRFQDNANLDKRLDSLGGANLHGGYKRFLSSLGGTNVHSYKRGIDSLGGAFIPAYKRYLSSLGGGQLHDGFKRSDDKRFLSSLGGGNVYSNKRNMADVDFNDGHKRFLSTLGGTNLHYGIGPNKRYLSSLGGTNVHSGFKRDFQSENDELVNEGDKIAEEKRELDTLGGFSLHRYKRGDLDTKENTNNAKEALSS